jgi:outer membrane biosynthesis protein TonB
MKTLFRTNSLFFGALAIGLGATTGLVLAGQTVHRPATPASLTVSLAGHQSERQAPPAPEATESPEPPAPGTEPEPEPAETAEAEPAEAAEPEEHPSPTPTAATASSSQTFSLTGGTVTLSCPSFGAIMLDSASPTAGFSFEQSREDGDSTIEIRFESSSHESRLQADCAGGQVQVLELREESN